MADPSPSPQVTHYYGDGCPEHPMHLGPCVRALDGDGDPLGYCMACYQDLSAPEAAQDCLDTVEVDGELLGCDRPAGHDAAHSCVFSPEARMAWLPSAKERGRRRVAFMTDDAEDGESRG